MALSLPVSGSTRAVISLLTTWCIESHLSDLNLPLAIPSCIELALLADNTQHVEKRTTRTDSADLRLMYLNAQSTQPQRMKERERMITNTCTLASHLLTRKLRSHETHVLGVWKHSVSYTASVASEAVRGINKTFLVRRVQPGPTLPQRLPNARHGDTDSNQWGRRSGNGLHSVIADGWSRK